MGNSKNFDISANTFEDLVTEEFAGTGIFTHDDQKTEINCELYI